MQNPRRLNKGRLPGFNRKNLLNRPEREANRKNLQNFFGERNYRDNRERAIGADREGLPLRGNRAELLVKRKHLRTIRLHCEENSGDNNWKAGVFKNTLNHFAAKSDEGS